jgi:hypothetical protein
LQLDELRAAVGSPGAAKEDQDDRAGIATVGKVVFLTVQIWKGENGHDLTNLWRPIGRGHSFSPPGGHSHAQG